MSGAYLLENSGNLPPVVPTSFVTNSGTAVPVANSLNELGSQTSSNNNVGLQSIGSGNTVTYQLTNRATAQLTTADATLTTIITFPLAASGTVYSISGIVTARITATGAGGSYDFLSAFRTDGATATEIGTEYPSTFEDASLVAADIFVIASGNNVLLQIQGVAATAINWDAYLTFRQVS